MACKAYQILFKVTDQKSYTKALNELAKIMEQFQAFVDFLKKDSELISLVLQFENQFQVQHFLNFINSVTTIYGQLIIQELVLNQQQAKHKQQELAQNYYKPQNQYFSNYQNQSQQLKMKAVIQGKEQDQYQQVISRNEITSKHQKYQIQLDKLLIFSDKQYQEILKWKFKQGKEISHYDFFLGFEILNLLNPQTIFHIKQHIIQHKLNQNFQNQVIVTNFNNNKTNYYNLINVYGIFGNIQFIIIDKTNNRSIIQYQTSRSAYLALENTHQLILFGHNINTFYNKKQPVNLLNKIEIGIEDEEIYLVSKRHWRYRSDRRIKLNPLSTKLHITNLSQDVSEYDIYNLFGYVHKPSKIRRIYYRQRLMYVVEMEQEFQATDILAVFHNTSLNERSMIISYSYKYTRNQ